MRRRFRRSTVAVCCRAALCTAVLWAGATGAWAQDGSAASGPLGWLYETMSQRGVWLGLIAVFLGGMALNLTPCVYPLIPVTLAFFSNQASGSVRRTALLAGCYIVGIAASYAILGSVAAQTGALLGSWLQHPGVLIGVALVITILALSMFGLYDVRLPSRLTNRFGQGSSGLGGAVVMGLVVGIVAAPCIGPFVLGLFLFVSQLADPVKGFVIFFTLGLGMGLPYVVLALGMRRIGQLPKAGSWLVWSKKALGIVLLGLAVYLVRPLLSESLLRVTTVGLLLGAGVYLGWMERHARGAGAGRGLRWTRWTVGGALIASAALVAWPRPGAMAAVEWRPYRRAEFEQALTAQRPMVIDLYADWCLPCVEMDHVTFRHPDVVQALQSVTTLRLDATRGISAEGEELIDRYDVYGVPTVLLFDRTGRERTDLRLLGFVKPKEFLRRIAQLQ